MILIGSAGVLSERYLFSLLSCVVSLIHLAPFVVITFKGNDQAYPVVLMPGPKARPQQKRDSTG